MRDILTVLAGLLILVLAAVLAVPPLLDWTAHRPLVDRAMSRALGQPVRSAGPLDIRLLPYPRIRLGRLRIGADGGEDATLDAMYVRAEIGLTPLLAGEVRFLETRIGRAELKLPTGAGGDWRVPRRLLAGIEQRRAWAFEDLSVQQFFLTTFDPSSGRTDQAYAGNLRVQAPSFAGPWRVEGTAGSAPFELSLGEFAPDLSSSVKLRGGGDGLPRLDVDGRLELAPASGDVLTPRFAGSSRLAFPSPPPPPGSGRPALQAQALLKASGRTVELEELAVEAGEGAGALRATGSGKLRLHEPRLTLALTGRRFDLAAFRAAYRPTLASGLSEWRRVSGDLPLELSLRLDSIAVGGDEDLTEFALKAALEDDRIRIAALDLVGPGRAAFRAEGEFVPGAAPTGSGRVSLNGQDGNRLWRFLAGVGLGADPGGLLDPRPFQASADVTLADPVLSVRNLRLALGDTTITGALRHSAADQSGRARIDGLLALSGLDVAALPDGALVFGATRGLDLGITVDARNVAYGPARGGRITGRVNTEGSAIVVEGLEVSGLAGAEASLSGRIADDGTGRIEGRLKAEHAAPLVDLFGRAWLGGLVRLLPGQVREGSVDLGVSAERAALPGSAAPGLRTRLSGRVAGGPFTAETLSASGFVREISARASTENEAGWLPGRSPTGPPRPASLEIAGRRGADGRLALAVKADLAGLRLASGEPLRLGPADDRLETGSGEITSADASRALALLGLSAAAPVPLALKGALGQSGAGLALFGQVAGEELAAELTVAPAGEIGGRLKLSRLSLPWLASALALNLPPRATAGQGSGWSGTRFGSPPELPVAGILAVEAARLDGLGRLSGREARFQLTARSEGVSLSGLDVAVAGGRLRGGFTLGRQGGLATLIGEGRAEGFAVADLLGPPFGSGRLSATLRFGASGESVAGLVAALGGAGEIDLDGLRIEAADPAGIERVASRVLKTDDPLASARWQALLAEELGRAPLVPDRARANASLVGGALRISPLLLASTAGSWQGSAAIDLKSLTLEARGLLQATALPRNWVGGPPAVSLGWTGPLAGPARVIDPAPLANGLAAVVLSRELDRIETFELDAAERQRRNARTEMERQRRLAAEEAARQARLRAEQEERARQEQERQRQEQDRQRQDAERRRRQDAERQRQQDQDRPPFEGERRPTPPPLPPDLRPPVQSGAAGGG